MLTLIKHNTTLQLLKIVLKLAKPVSNNVADTLLKTIVSEEVFYAFVITSA